MVLILKYQQTEKILCLKLGLMPQFTMLLIILGLAVATLLGQMLVSRKLRWMMFGLSIEPYPKMRLITYLRVWVRLLSVHPPAVHLAPHSHLVPLYRHLPQYLQAQALVLVYPPVRHPHQVLQFHHQALQAPHSVLAHQRVNLVLPRFLPLVAFQLLSVLAHRLVRVRQFRLHCHLVRRSVLAHQLVPH